MLKKSPGKISDLVFLLQTQNYLKYKSQDCWDHNYRLTAYKLSVIFMIILKEIKKVDLEQYSIVLDLKVQISKTFSQIIVMIQ